MEVVLTQMLIPSISHRVSPLSQGVDRHLLLVFTQILVGREVGELGGGRRGGGGGGGMGIYSAGGDADVFMGTLEDVGRGVGGGGGEESVFIEALLVVRLAVQTEMATVDGSGCAQACCTVCIAASV